MEVKKWIGLMYEIDKLEKMIVIKMSMAKDIKIEGKWQMHVIIKIHFFTLLKKKMNACV